MSRRMEAVAIFAYKKFVPVQGIPLSCLCRGSIGFLFISMGTKVMENGGCCFHCLCEVSGLDKYTCFGGATCTSTNSVKMEWQLPHGPTNFIMKCFPSISEYLLRIIYLYIKFSCPCSFQKNYQMAIIHKRWFNFSVQWKVLKWKIVGPVEMFQKVKPSSNCLVYSLLWYFWHTQTLVLIAD